MEVGGRGENWGQPALSTAALWYPLLSKLQGALGQSGQSPLFAVFTSTLLKTSSHGGGWPGRKLGTARSVHGGAVVSTAVEIASALGQSRQSPLFAVFRSTLLKTSSHGGGWPGRKLGTARSVHGGAVVSAAFEIEGALGQSGQSPRFAVLLLASDALRGSRIFFEPAHHI